MGGKRISFDGLSGLRQTNDSFKIVHCHGVFDVLHAGHLKYFEWAKARGTILVVTLTSDRHVNKGPGRPYFGENSRAEMLEALSMVDYVSISDHPTAVPVIKQLRPHAYVKGPDYKDLTKDVTGEIYNEKLAVESGGGQLIFADTETFSSSAAINRCLQTFSDEQKQTIELVKSGGGFEAIERAIAEIGKLKVLVVGEPIIDIYRFCVPEGISSKSPTISARFQYQEEYKGGSWAIENHLKSFAKDVVYKEGCYNICIKTRYISTDKSQRVFEVTDIPDKMLGHSNEFFIAQTLSEAKKSDVVVMADFGHGVFEEEVLGGLQWIEKFVGLNVQTNSSNFGFNVYSKHKRWDYLCLDTREVRLALHDRHDNPLSLAREVHSIEGKPLSITLGSNGAVFLKDYESYKSPAFSDQVIDATGAGDAYFAITTVLLASGCKPALVPFIGNVFAGLKTKIIGNKSSVSKASLLKACASILK